MSSSDVQVEVASGRPPSPRPQATGMEPRRRYEAPPLRWQDRYARLLVGIDLAAVGLACWAAAHFRFGSAGGALRGVPYSRVAFVLVPSWLVVLWLARAYEDRFLGTGSEEYRRVFDASVRLVAVVAMVAFLFRLEISRLFFGLALVLGTAGLLLGRYLARRMLYRLREQGRCVHRVILVGEAAQVIDLHRRFASVRQAGYEVVGCCTPSAGEQLIVADGVDPLPVLGSLQDVLAVVQMTQADTAAVASSPAVGAALTKRIAWELEGSGVDLLLAPGLMDVAGPRIHVRPVAGLPLLHVEEPELAGGRRLVKEAFDKSGALIGLLLCLPLLLGCVGLIVLTSRGSPFFRQVRVGKDGRHFRVLKLRTMRRDAEHHQASLADLNEFDGLLFKIRRDPRVTPVGRWLRRLSIDELPQLWNVLSGDMSLVGPRPPLPSEVEQYQREAHRRLMVKPGLTGLWQVSGRADLSWDDTVRLDLYYVENWSLALDFQILWRTVAAVARGSGAY